MLIEYGNTTVKPTWELNEEVPAGYSRIYYIISGDLRMQCIRGDEASAASCGGCIGGNVPH